MDDPSNRDKLLVEFEAERSIRRTARLLREKRSRIRDDLKQLVNHLALLLPLPPVADNNLDNAEILIEAANRLNDEVFTELLVEIIRETQNF